MTAEYPNGTMFWHGEYRVVLASVPKNFNIPKGGKLEGNVLLVAQGSVVLAPNSPPEFFVSSNHVLLPQAQEVRTGMQGGEVFWVKPAVAPAPRAKKSQLQEQECSAVA